MRSNNYSKIFIFLVCFLNIISYEHLFSQNTEEAERQEKIIIIKKGKPNKKHTIDIDGDKILINGKEVDKYISEDKKIIIERKQDSDDITNRDGKRHFFFKSPNDEKPVREYPSPNDGKRKVLLGVFLSQDNSNDGARVLKVMPKSPAEEAGIETGDIITQVDEDKIKNNKQLTDKISSYSSGDTLSITIVRSDKELSKKVVLVSTESYQDEINKRDYKSKKYFKAPPLRDLEFWNKPPLPKLWLTLKNTMDDKGVEITSIKDNTPAASAGLKLGDVIIKVGDNKVTNLIDFKKSLRKFSREKKEKLQVEFERDNKTKKATIIFEGNLTEEEF